MVTLYHLWRSAGAPEHALSSGFSSFDLFGFFSNGHVGVELFFVISGYCMMLSSVKLFTGSRWGPNLARYFTSRFLRIAVPYYFAIIFWDLMISYMGVTRKPNGVFDNITHFLFVHNFFPETFFSISGVFWSLAVEVQFYILLPLYFLVKSFKFRCAILAVSVFLSLFVNFTYYTNHLVTWSVVSYLPLFLFGALLSEVDAEKIPVAARGWCVYLFIFICAMLLMYRGDLFSRLGQSFDILTGGALGFLMFLLLPFFSESSCRVVSIVSSIGRASFSIYLYNYIYRVLVLDGSTSSTLIFGVLFVFLFGWLMYNLIEVPVGHLRRSVDQKLRWWCEKTQ